MTLTGGPRTGGGRRAKVRATVYDGPVGRNRGGGAESMIRGENGRRSEFPKITRCYFRLWRGFVLSAASRRKSPAWRAFSAWSRNFFLRFGRKTGQYMILAIYTPANYWAMLARTPKWSLRAEQLAAVERSRRGDVGAGKSRGWWSGCSALRPPGSRPRCFPTCILRWFATSAKIRLACITLSLRYFPRMCAW